MTTVHNLGFPRIGHQRELKWAIENYWRGNLTGQALQDTGWQLRNEHWSLQRDLGMDLLPVGDFSWYDHVLDTAVMFGVIPERFRQRNNTNVIDTLFLMARGRAPGSEDVTACEMTKWFDTNYHYIVPEFTSGQSFSLNAQSLFAQIEAAKASGFNIKPVLLGPLSFLWLGKCTGGEFNKLNLLPALLECYASLVKQIDEYGIEWLQIDEPILVLDLPVAWKQSFETAYRQLHQPKLKLLLTTYFGGLEDNLQLAAHLPTEGLHVDVIAEPTQLHTVADHLPGYKTLSVGIIDGRNIWRSDLEQKLNQLEPLHDRLGNRLWLAPSCSLLHCPVDLISETRLDNEVKSWFSFAVQKLTELNTLRLGLAHGRDAIADELRQNSLIHTSRKNSSRIHRAAVQDRLKQLTPAMTKRADDYTKRSKIQHQVFQLPLLPTTTIGSFPQTETIRAARRNFKTGGITQAEYDSIMKGEIAYTIKRQSELGLDVLVHGEPERNDMVEYFGELLEGFAFTQNGWVQSYGTRCVKPPVIYGDVCRSGPMTVSWSQYAQSLTEKPVKGMLTGPVTMLKWSFVRDDQPLRQTCRQIALALRDEVNDLEAGGIGIIQIDEAALREGLPLRKAWWDEYLSWAVESFQLCANGVKNQTQIHTHMCYAEFNDIIEWVARLDADVITIETSRSHMALLDAFKRYNYPNEIGPGTYDIHSPRIPGKDEIAKLIEKAMHYIPPQRLWVNPDCGLKTRNWPEVENALFNMIEAAKTLRAQVDTV